MAYLLMFWVVPILSSSYDVYNFIKNYEIYNQVQVVGYRIWNFNLYGSELHACMCVYVEGERVSLTWLNLSESSSHIDHCFCPYTNVVCNGSKQLAWSATLQATAISHSLRKVMWLQYLTNQKWIWVSALSPLTFFLQKYALVHLSNLF